MKRRHAMPFGAEILDSGGVRFRLWAPAARTVALCLEGPGRRSKVAMTAAPGGWFAVETSKAGAGTRYRYLIDGETRVPDPASRFQPDDVHGASEVIDPEAFDWTDGAWSGRPWEEAVLYELHVGTFTREGTFAGAVGRLDDLVELGVTAIELMPVADAPGRRNWGYDGAYPFAPESGYGRPEELKELVQAAHERGLMVFLDVVYNHFGPEGNYLHRYAPQFFTERYHTPWGPAVDFEGGKSRTVRDFFIHNALYWIEEYHLDGLRLDAVHAIFDRSEPDILSELAATVRERVGESRHVHLVLENDKNAARYLARGEEGRPRGYVAQWNDDAHHALHALLTGERFGYYADYIERPAWHLGRALAEGFAYQGEPSPYRDDAPRGEPSAHLPPTAFVCFLQNHDQVGNRAFGERITELAEPAALRAAVALLLLAPSPPLLFMGEEWGAARRFPFFCDFEPELALRVREGRAAAFARFPQFRDPESRARIPDPNAHGTFAAAVLDWADRARAPHRDWLDFYRRLLRLRRQEIVPRLKGLKGHSGTFRTSGRTGLLLRWRLGDGSLLSLSANMGSEAALAPLGTPQGRPLFVTDADLPARLVEGVLPPWSVAWLLDAPGSTGAR